MQIGRWAGRQVGMVGVGIYIKSFFKYFFIDLIFFFFV